MTDRTNVALGAVWEETVAFVKAEWNLLLPVALLGFGLPMLGLLLSVPVDVAQAGKLEPGPWMFWFLPCGLLSMTGSLAVSALALRPGSSVRECLMLAVSRLPGGIGLFLLNIVVQIALAVPLTVASLIETQLTGKPGPIWMMTNLAVLAITIWLFVRVLPVWAVLSERPQSPWVAVLEAFRLTRGHYPKLLLLRLVGASAGMLVMVVLLIPIGGVFAVLGKVTGSQDISQMLAFVAVAAVFAVLAGIWTVYVARLQRRLADLKGPAAPR